MIIAITTIICVCAASATFGMLAVAFQNYNPGSWAGIVGLGGWDAQIYAGIVAVSLSLRNSRSASIVVMIGALVVSGFSVFVLYNDLHFYFTPPTPTSRVMNCGGPLVQLALPILQWPTLGVFAGVAYVIHRSGRTTENACSRPAVTP